MSANSHRLMKISETAYLSADKFLLYRTIMRILYNEKEMFNAQLSTEEIFEKVRQTDEFSDITIEELKSALGQLTDWGNLVPMQDPRRAATIEEYKNKMYRYSLSEYSIKIERMTVELENLFSEGNTLSSSLLLRIDGYLQDIEKILEEKDLKKVYEWWNNLQIDFGRLNQNYSDYIHAFYSVSGEKMLRSVDFIQHKDKFVDYLRDFIRILQKYSVIIEKMLIGISDDTRERLLNKILLSEIDQPRTNADDFSEEAARNKINGQWHALDDWFVTRESKMSKCGMAMEYTNQIIRKILTNAVMIMQLRSSGISRKQNYKQYMKMFAACKDINEAHCLSAHVFGAMDTSHYRYNSARETDSIFENAADLDPQLFEVRPRTRTYKPRIKTQGFTDKSMRKAAERTAILEKKKNEQRLIESFIVNGRISVAELENTVVPEVLRTSLLRWISDANRNKSGSGTTDFGRKFHLRKDDGKAVLHCVDGELYMPSYIIEFEEKADE